MYYLSRLCVRTFAVIRTSCVVVASGSSFVPWQVLTHFALAMQTFSSFIWLQWRDMRLLLIITRQRQDTHPLSSSLCVCVCESLLSTNYTPIVPPHEKIIHRTHRQNASQMNKQLTHTCSASFLSFLKMAAPRPPFEIGLTFDQSNNFTTAFKLVTN